MSYRLRAVLLVLAWLLVPLPAWGQSGEEHDTEVITPPLLKPSESEKKPDLRQVVGMIVEQTNAFRKEQGRSAVQVNDHLTRAARYFADYMAKNDRFGHHADGKGPAARASKHDYDYCIVLENIAYEYSSAGFTSAELARGFVEGWKHSPGHRRNMLDRDVTDTGVAVARSERTGYYYAVQMFGRPHSLAIHFTVVNRSDGRVEYQVGTRSFPLAPDYSRTHTICRPAALKVHLPGENAKKQARTFRPAGGERFVITGEGETYQVKKE